MQEDQDSRKETQERTQKDRVRDFLSHPEITGVAIGFWVFVGSFFLLRLYIYDHIPADPNRTTVLIESMFSLALAIVIIIQAGIYFRQAKALDAQITATERNTIYGQRAYVYAKLPEVSDDDIFDLVLTIENSGNSPANDVTLFYKFGFQEREPHKDTGDWKIFTGRPTNRIGLLAPKTYYPLNLYNRPVPTPEEVRRFYVRYWTYNCWGEITYTDVFRNKWYTSFSFYVIAVGGKRVVMPCLTGNEAT